MINNYQPKTSVGQTILILRESKGITQKELAERCNVSNVHISNIERGLKFPSQKLKRLISDSLDLSELEFDATLTVFSGIPVNKKQFTPKQIEFLTTLQTLVLNAFKTEEETI